jgi:RNA polymerase sigma factor (sigma-70 family)
VDGLSPRQRRIVHLRYERGLSQSEIAALVGGSQVTISRELRRISQMLATELEPAG